MQGHQSAQLHKSPGYRQPELLKVLQTFRNSLATYNCNGSPNQLLSNFLCNAFKSNLSGGCNKKTTNFSSISYNWTVISTPLDMLITKFLKTWYHTRVCCSSWLRDYRFIAVISKLSENFKQMFILAELSTFQLQTFVLIKIWIIHVDREMGHRRDNTWSMRRDLCWLNADKQGHMWIGY